MKSTLSFIFLLLSVLNLHAQNCPVPDPNNRTQIYALTAPQTFIAQIVVNRHWLFIQRHPVSTCSFVSPNVLVTAGHTMKEKWYKSQIKSVTVYIGKHEANGAETWIRTETFDVNAIKKFINPTFQESGNADFDYSYVALPKKMTQAFFSLSTYEQSSAIDSVYITGYPGDKKNALGISAEQLWQKGDKLTNLVNLPHILLYSIFTAHGDSGAPIWVKHNQQFYIIGIHGTGVYGNGHLNCNGGIKFTDERLTELRDFINTNSL